MSLINSYSFTRLNSLTSSHQTIERPPLYLPDARYVKAITLGFNNFASDLLWFGTLDYFGRQFESSGDYKFLAARCELVTQLDPKGQEVYEFCTTLLSWVAKQPEKAYVIISRAIQNRPLYWRNYYLRGFISWYFLEDNKSAAQDMRQAATMPSAPSFLNSLASKLMMANKEPETAIQFLKSAMAREQNSQAKIALREKLLNAYVSRDISLLNTQLRLYEQKMGRKAQNLQELVREKMLRFIPRDPNGDAYILDSESYQSTSVSFGIGLTFAGKTARTGIARREFNQ